MILYTNGCSWTWGGALEQHYTTEEERLKLCWPHHLGELLQCDEVHNLSIGCGSNGRILRTTFDYINNADPKKLKETVAVIQLSDPSRFEFYAPVNFKDPFENLSDRWARCKTDIVCLPEDGTFDFEKMKNFANKIIGLSTNTSEDYKTLFEVMTLTSMFNEYGIKHFFWSNIYNPLVNVTPMKQKIQTYSWIYSWTTTSYWDYERISKEDSHPSVNGHRQLGQIIYNEIKDKI